MARRGVTGASIRVEGLGALIRDFSRLEKQLAKDLRRELIDIGELVAAEARDKQMPEQQLAGGQGGADREPNTGQLQNSIRSRMRGSMTIVEQRRTTKRRFAYGSIYEFDKGRPFLGPALEARSEDVIEALDDMLDRLVSANGFGRGGIL